jgi:hypothetical protein
VLPGDALFTLVGLAGEGDIDAPDLITPKFVCFIFVTRSLICGHARVSKHQKACRSPRIRRIV